MNDSLDTPVSHADSSAFGRCLRSLRDYEIGVIPLPYFIGIALIVFLSAHFGYLPKNMIGGLAVIMTLGVFFGQLGQRLPILKEIGGGAILCLMLPSVLVFYGFFGSTTIDATKMLMKEANFLYFVIASLVVGSILGMSRFILVQGMIRMFVPLLVGTLAAVAAGIAVGALFGYSVYHTFFFIIVPIIGGGIGEGILPLSLAYSAILGGTPEQYVAQLVPAAVVGNIVAIICAGVLARLALKRPALNGDGVLIRAKAENDAFQVQEEASGGIDYRYMGAGVLLICAFFILGGPAGESGGYSGAGDDDPGGGGLQIPATAAAQPGGGQQVVLQAGVHGLYLAGDDRPGHALCALGQRGQGVFRGLPGGLHVGGGGHDTGRVLYRQPAEDVPHRIGHRHLLPQRSGRHRGCGDSVGVQPHGADAFRADFHAHWRGLYGDPGDRAAENLRLTVRRARRYATVWG